MQKSQLQKKRECFLSGCPYYERHCGVFHGNDCKQLDGDRIPRMRNIGPAKPVDYHNRLSTTFKPYFVTAEVDEDVKESAY